MKPISKNGYLCITDTFTVPPPPSYKTRASLSFRSQVSKMFAQILILTVAQAIPLNLEDEIMKKVITDRFGSEKIRLSPLEITDLLVEHYKRLDSVKSPKEIRKFEVGESEERSANLQTVNTVSGSNNHFINGNGAQVTNNYYFQIGEDPAHLEHLIKLIMQFTKSEEPLGTMVNDVLDIVHDRVQEDTEFEYEEEPQTTTEAVDKTEVEGTLSVTETTTPLPTTVKKTTEDDATSMTDSATKTSTTTLTTTSTTTTTTTSTATSTTTSTTTLSTTTTSATTSTTVTTKSTTPTTTSTTT